MKEEDIRIASFSIVLRECVKQNLPYERGGEERR